MFCFNFWSRSIKPQYRIIAWRRNKKRSLWRRISILNIHESNFKFILSSPHLSPVQTGKNTQDKLELSRFTLISWVNSSDENRRREQHCRRRRLSWRIECLRWVEIPTARITLSRWDLWNDTLEFLMRSRRLVLIFNSPPSFKLVERKLCKKRVRWFHWFQAHVVRDENIKWKGFPSSGMRISLTSCLHNGAFLPFIHKIAFAWIV